MSKEKVCFKYNPYIESIHSAAILPLRIPTFHSLSLLPYPSLTSFIIMCIINISTKTPGTTNERKPTLDLFSVINDLLLHPLCRKCL